MRFYWLWNRNKNKNFDIYWDAGHNNLAGFYTNNHTAQHHKYTKNICMRQIKLHAITIYELHAVTHATRVCWDKTVYPAYNDVIITRC